MDNENLGGEKAILEERRKKLDQLRDKGSATGIHLNHKIKHKNFMMNMDHFQKKN